MTLLTGWPSITDDDGSGKTGTPVDKAWADAVKAAIEALVHSSSNPTVSPAQAIDKVVEAYGNLTSLEDRIDGVIDVDGNLVAPASIINAAQLQDVLGYKNLAPMNGDFLMWHRGDALAPTGFTLSGTGAAVARTGVGLGDTWSAIGPYGAKVTYGSATAELVIPVLDAAAMPAWLKGQYFGFGATLKSSIANHARLFIDDGVSKKYSAYHSDAGNDEFVAIAQQISAAATKIDLGFSVEQAGAAYVDGLTLGIGNRAPTRYIPCRSGLITYPIKVGTPAIADGVEHIRLPFPWIIRNVYGVATTAPSGGVLTIDVERSDSGGWASIFSGAKTLLADGKNTGRVQPDGTYEYRCVAGTETDASTALATTDDGIVRLNIDAVNGADGLTVYIEALAYMAELNAFMLYDDFVG